jgi:3-oxoadipate enol-lactonase
VVVGESDYATPVAMSQDIMGRLPGAELAVLDGLRHYTPMEAPDRVARRITSVLVRASSLPQ